MPSALLSSAQKDIIGSQARDLTALVRQVKDILPQFSDDQACDALVQSNEDVSRAVELLMSQQPASKASKKKDKHKNREARAQAEAEATEAAFESAAHDDKECVEERVNEPREERPKTAAEKEAAKLKKKLREIERIEDKVAKGEKVDPLQLPKLDKKRETETELRAAEQKILQEEEERRYQEAQQKKQEEYERQREAQEAERRRQEEAAAYAHQQAAARILPEPFRHVSDRSWLSEDSAPQAAPDRHQHIGSELLNMLHKAPQENKATGFTQSEQTAQHLGGGSYTRGTLQQANGEDYRQGYRSEQQAYQRPYSQQHYNSYSYGQYNQQYGSQQSRYQDWKQEDWRQRGSWNKEIPREKPRPELPGEGPPGDDAPKADWANLYSTQLDISSIPADKRAEAERIAFEIEQNSGGGDGWDRPDAGSKANGKGEYSGKNGKSKGKGKKGKGKGKPRPEWSKDGGGREWQPKQEDWGKQEDWQPKAEEWQPKAAADWGPPGL